MLLRQAENLYKKVFILIHVMLYLISITFPKIVCNSYFLQIYKISFHHDDITFIYSIF